MNSSLSLMRIWAVLKFKETNVNISGVEVVSHLYLSIIQVMSPKTKGLGWSPGPEDYNSVSKQSIEYITIFTVTSVDFSIVFRINLLLKLMLLAQPGLNYFCGCLQTEGIYKNAWSQEGTEKIWMHLASDHEWSTEIFKLTLGMGVSTLCRSQEREK